MIAEGRDANRPGGRAGRARAGCREAVSDGLPLHTNTMEKPGPKSSENKLLASNRRASYRYFLSDHLEAGLVLSGSEVKAVRSGKANLIDAYAVIRDGEAWLLNCHIGPYEYAHRENHEARSKRKLLLHRREIRKLTGKTTEKGLTLIPTKMYLKNGRIKCEIALAKGKKLWDQRETIRRRETDRETRQAMRQRG